MFIYYRHKTKRRIAADLKRYEPEIISSLKVSDDGAL
jgi:hypothetical protein